MPDKEKPGKEDVHEVHERIILLKVYYLLDIFNVDSLKYLSF